jgi:hypothetical protein
VNISRAVATGLKFRPLEQTVRDTLEWVNRPARRRARAERGPREDSRRLTAERERELLSQWRERIASRGRSRRRIRAPPEGARP